MCSFTMRARWPIGTPSSTQSSRSSAGIARKSTPFATNPPAYCGSSSAARNAEMSFGREADGASTAVWLWVLIFIIYDS